jgi:type I restriction-modification system DNA methylase subunit
LGTTKPRRGVGRERVSYRELEIEQLGSVYEGLLEYEPRTADQTKIEVVVQGRDFALTPVELKRLCEQKQLVLKGDAAIVRGTDAACLHPDNVDEDETSAELNDEGDPEAGNDEGEDQKIRRWAKARLIRRLNEGEFYFVPGSARKSSGSFYTPEEIVQYLVCKTLEGLVENRAPAEIESLRIIDLACGSAHFLVGAARFLGKRLLDAYHRELKNAPPPEFYPDHSLSDDVQMRWQNEGEAWCKRRIIEKCLFGVDLNPTAVQLAKVALWIESLAGDRPLSFFAHHIRTGNSLLGTWLDRLHQPPHPALDDRCCAPWASSHCLRAERKLPTRTSQRRNALPLFSRIDLRLQ